MATTPLKTPPPTPPRSIWQRQIDRDIKYGAQINGYNQGADIFTRTQPDSGPGSPRQGATLVSDVIRAIDRLTGVRND